MASVTLPSPDEVWRRMGLSVYAQIDEDTNYDAEEAIADAAAECALAVGEGTFDSSSLTARQAQSLAKAVCFRAAAQLLYNPMVRKLLGTHEPILAENSEAFRALIEAMLEKAQELEGLVTVGSESSADVPFRYPSFAATAPTYTSSDRSVSERNLLTDTSDNIPSHDTDSG